MPTTPPPAGPDEADGWVPVEGIEPIAEFTDLDRIDVLDEISHRIRGPLLRRLRVPRSAAELAAELDVPITRLYHHLNVLESAGLIQVVATRKVAAATERRYRCVSRGYRLPPALVEDGDPRDLARAFGGIVDGVKANLLDVVEGRTIAAEDVAIWSMRVRLDSESYAALVDRIGALLADYQAGAPDAAPSSGETTNGEVEILAVAFPLEPTGGDS